MAWTVHHGDCITVMAAMPDGSVDAVVCDPPAGISFMSKGWDHHRGGRNEWVEWMADVMREALRVCKPGAHAFVWALPRTSHWTGSALELAGWEVRDVCTHLFGSGFPKSHNLPNGIGTALKPAAEFWWLARKPLSGTVAQTVLEHRTGGLNVDGCRVRHASEDDRNSAVPGGPTSVAPLRYGGQNHRPFHDTNEAVPYQQNQAGRWPANVVLSHTEECVPVGTRKFKPKGATGRTGGATGSGASFVSGKPHAGYRGEDGTETLEAWECHPDCPVRLLDEQTGELPSAGRYADVPGRTQDRAEAVAANTPFTPGNQDPNRYANETGGPSRFFYVAKASRAERNAGLDGDRSTHPTVKPISLMRWLVRLVTPPGGTVLDPFAGSGSTGCAAVLEGFAFVGIEREPEYADIAEARIGWWEKHRGDGEAAAILAAGEARDELEQAGQEALF